MKRDEIIRMAREAAASPYTNRHFPDRPFFTFSPEQLERFDELVAAAERDACAQACDAMANGWEQNPGSNPLAGYIAASNCAEAIRARGQKEPT